MTGKPTVRTVVFAKIALTQFRPFHLWGLWTYCTVTESVLGAVLWLLRVSCRCCEKLRLANGAQKMVVRAHWHLSSVVKRVGVVKRVIFKSRIRAPRMEGTSSKLNECSQN